MQKVYKQQTRRSSKVNLGSHLLKLNKMPNESVLGKKVTDEKYLPIRGTTSVRFMIFKYLSC